MARISGTPPISELNGFPIPQSPPPPTSKNTSSPPNVSFKPGPVRDSATDRRAAETYTEEMHQRFIRRMLKNMPSLRHEGKSISIRQYNGEPWMVNPPYGFLPFALMSEKGEVDKEALIKAINWCGDRKTQYEKSGDYYRMWLFAQRQSMLAGILTHLVNFTLA